VFTEYAKEQEPSLKLGIEERAGALAKYIASTARQL
jgi:ACT domain-containing protein